MTKYSRNYRYLYVDSSLPPPPPHHPTCIRHCTGRNPLGGADRRRPLSLPVAVISPGGRYLWKDKGRASTR